MSKQKSNTEIKRNQIDGLQNFDWNKPIDGPTFKSYMELFGNLLLNDKYLFEEWLATSVQKFRINENTGDKEEYIAGIKLHGKEPINTTLITVKNAMTLNSFVTHNLSERSNSRYYLLAIPKEEAAKVS